MSANDPEYHRAYKQKHYAENKQRYIDQAAARREKLAEEVRLLKSKPCCDCGVQYAWWVMQFDHRDPAQKESYVSHLVRDYKRKKVFEEIEKCDVVCANCHADRTYRRSHADVV